jgi:hypothetical protein
MAGMMSLCSIFLLMAETAFLKDGVIPVIAFWGSGGAAVLVGAALMILYAAMALANSDHTKPLLILSIVQGSLLAAQMILGIVAAAMI